MPATLEPAAAYREAIPSDSTIAKNLDDFKAGLLDIENRGKPESERVEEIVPEPEKVEEVVETIEQVEPEKVEARSIADDVSELDTPLGKVELPTKKKEEAKIDPPEKLESTPEVSDEEIGKEFPKKDKDARSEFIRMRKQIKALENEKAQLEPLKSEVETLRTKKPEIKLEEVPEYVDLQKQLKERDEALRQREEALQHAHKIVALADFKKTPEYEKAVTEPWSKKIVPGLQQLAKDKGLDLNSLVSLVQTRDESVRKAKFEEIATSAELGTYEQRRLLKAMDDYDIIADAHSYLENNAIEAQKMSQEERKRHSEEGLKQYKGIFTKSLNEYRGKLQDTWFPNIKADPDLQEATSKINERVDALNWYEIPPEKHGPILETAMKAPLLHMIYEAKWKKDIEERDTKIADYEKKIKDLESALSKVSKATPAAGSQGRSTERAPDTTKISSKEKYGIAESIADLD